MKDLTSNNSDDEDHLITNASQESLIKCSGIKKSFIQFKGLVIKKMLYSLKRWKFTAVQVNIYYYQSKHNLSIKHEHNLIFLNFTVVSSPTVDFFRNLYNKQSPQPRKI